MEERTIRCDYCGKQNPPSNSTQHKIFFRDRRPGPGGKAFCNTRIGNYCKDKGCGGSDQMAHEG